MKAMTIDTLMGRKPNRIEVACDAIEKKLATLDGAAVARLKDATKLSADEFFVFQQTQAEAHAGGKLTFDEAQNVYAALGGSTQSIEDDGWPVETSLALRITVTKLMTELLAAKLGKRRAR